MSSLLDPELQRKIDHPRLIRDDPSFAAGKMAAFQYLSVGVFLFLIAGFWQLQVQQPEVYTEAAERNRVKQFPIPAPRGKILDRDGRVIVDNHSSWALMLTRENLKEEHLPAIAEGLHLDLEDLQAKVAKYRRRPSYEPIIIKEELSPADLAFVDSHRDPEMFPELILIHDQPRLYPQNGMGAHWIGYTGEVSEAELDTAEFAKYNPGAVIGKFGIERQYNDFLTGTDGERQVEVDNRGRERKVLQTTEAIPGKNVQLTVDLDVQVVADLVMEGKSGSIVALDPRNGEVLAMASRPAFDPNKFTARIKSSDMKKLLADPGNPFLNRAIQSQLAPGSTFKPIMAGMTGLETDWNHRSRDDLPLLWRRIVLRALLSLLGSARAWDSQYAGGNRPLVRRLFLQRRQPAGDRQYRALCGTGGVWEEDRRRDLPGEACAAWFLRSNESSACTGRNGTRGRRFRWRSGQGDFAGVAAAVGVRDGRVGARRGLVHAAHAEIADSYREAAKLGRRSRQRRESEGRHDASGQNGHW